MLKTPPNSRRPGERGSSLLEGALCLTAFLMIVFGTIDFGRMIFAYNFVAYGAREGTRYAAVHGITNPVDGPAVTTFVSNEAVALDPNLLTVNTTWAPDHKPGSTVQVRVQYSFAPIAPYMPTGTITLSSTSKMLVSQ